MTYDDKIQDYLDGILDKGQSEAFERELGTNKELKEKFNSYKIARDLAKGLLEIDLQSTLDDAKQNEKSIAESEIKLKPKLGLKYILIPLLLILVAVVSYWLLNKKDTSTDPPVLFAEVYKEPIWPVTRNEKDSLGMVMASFLSTNNVSVGKKDVLSLSVLEDTMKNYWISEMFLMNEEWDSVRFYLPTILPENIKYDRVQEIRSWLETFGK